MIDFAILCTFYFIRLAMSVNRDILYLICCRCSGLVLLSQNGDIIQCDQSLRQVNLIVDKDLDCLFIGGSQEMLFA